MIIHLIITTFLPLFPFFLVCVYVAAGGGGGGGGGVLIGVFEKHPNGEPESQLMGVARMEIYP